MQTLHNLLASLKAQHPEDFEEPDIEAMTQDCAQEFHRMVTGLMKKYGKDDGLHLSKAAVLVDNFAFCASRLAYTALPEIVAGHMLDEAKEKGREPPEQGQDYGTA